MPLKYERDDGQEAEIDEAKLTKIVWKDDDGQQHEVEGHGFRRGLSDEPDVEGHGFRGGLSDEPDVEGHGFVVSREGEEFDVDLDKVVRIVWKDDDGTEHDVEGHRFRFS